jgi:transposase
MGAAFPGGLMARITRAASHLSAEGVKTRLKLDPRPWCRQRWLIIYNALVDPRAAKEIATHTGTSVAMVHQVISTYNRFGVMAVETPGKGGRRHQYLKWEEEQAFLAPFFSRAEKGEIATAEEIKRAFEASIGHEVDESTIYRLLGRHRWRKPVPRPVHPQADPEAQEQFKKTLRSPLRRQSPPELQRIVDRC